MIQIQDRKIGPGFPTFVVAELSANHNQCIDRALDLVRAASSAGADAVKLQTYTADTLTIDCDHPPFQIKGGTLWDGRTLYELYEQAHTPWDWHEEIKDLAESLGLIFFSTPFDNSSVDFLESLDVSAYKVVSFEIVDTPLLKKIAATGRPVIMSTGMASQFEIQQAVDTLRNNGADQIALLKCTSAYPAPPESMNLKTIPFLASEFDCIAGLSDHTLCHTAAMSSVAIGGCIIEKHLTLDRSDPGPDSDFSLEPNEFKEMVRQVRTVEKCLGGVSLATTESETASVRFRRSLFAVEDIQAGDIITTENVRSIRPGDGLSPCHLENILGKSAASSIPRGTPLNWKHVA